MIVYNQQGINLEEVKEKPFILEKDIQNLFEANLKAIMGLQLVKSEFTIKNKRIDTLAFDPEAKAFIIIEYKRDKNHSVVDQGVSYLNLMLEYKADFIIEYNESLSQNLKRDDIDWSQTKVCFVSPSFTENQKQATNFKDLSIELYELKRYANGIIIINPIKKSASAPSIKPIAKQNELLQKVAEEIIEYTEDIHINKGSEFTAELYQKFKNSILQLDDNIETKPKKHRISFQVSKKIITDIAILKRSLKIWINLKRGELDDPRKIARDMSSIGHWGNGDYEIVVTNDKDMQYIMSLIRQAL